MLALGGDPNSGPAGFVLWMLGRFGPPIAAVLVLFHAAVNTFYSSVVTEVTLVDYPVSRRPPRCS